MKLHPLSSNTNNGPLAHLIVVQQRYVLLYTVAKTSWFSGWFLGWLNREMPPADMTLTGGIWLILGGKIDRRSY